MHPIRIAACRLLPDRRRLLSWTQKTARHELSLVQPLDALGFHWQRLVPALIVRQLEACRRFVALEQAGRRQLADEARPHGSGLPEAIQVSIGPSTLPAAWIWPTTLRKTRAFLNPDRDFENDFETNFEDYFTYSPKTIGFETHFASEFESEFESRFVRLFARHFVSDFTRSITAALRATLKSMSRDFSLIFTDAYTRRFATEIAGKSKKFSEPDLTLGEFTVVPGLPSEVPQPSLNQGIGDLQKADAAFRREDSEAGKKHLAGLFARQIGELWLGVATACRRKRREATAYAQRRSQHRWLLEVWPEVDRRLGKEPSSDAVALYLALGWTQACSTWTFPGTRRWVETIKAGPPEHWLPRSQWHLCWLIYKEDAENRQGLRDALDEGEGDEERPGVAAAIRELVDSPTD